MSRGRRPPRDPPTRVYGPGVDPGFVDFVEERDERAREDVRRYRAVRRLYRLSRRGR